MCFSVKHIDYTERVLSNNNVILSIVGDNGAVPTLLYIQELKTLLRRAVKRSNAIIF